MSITQNEDNNYMTWTTIMNDPKMAEWCESLKPSTAKGYRSGMVAICNLQDNPLWDASLGRRG